MAFCLLFISKIDAQNWTGNTNSDWNNSSNWSSWPLSGEDILIDPANYTGAAASPVITSNSVFSPEGLIVQNGAVLTIQANLTCTKRIELFNTGTVVHLNAGTLFASGSGSQGRFIISDGAAVVQTGGVAKANQRIIVELGGVYTLNNGTVNPIEELAIGDGNTSGSSLFSMNGGSLITQGLGFENEAGFYFPTFDMSGGSLSITGDISWLGVSPGTGTPRFIMSGGTGTVTGSIFNDPATTVNLYVSLKGTADLSISGAITLINTTDSISFSDNALITLSGNNTLSNPGVWYANSGTAIFNGTTSLQGTGSYRMNHVLINTAKTLNHVSPANLSIIGNFTNNGSFNANGNTVSLEGTTAQTVGGNSQTTFRNLTLDNSSATGIDLNNGITITGNLELLNGKLNSSITNLITLTDNATASSGTANSFVNGPVKKIGDDVFVFPVGKNNRWRRLSISAPVSTGTEFIGEYFDNSAPVLSPVNAPLQSVSAVEYWKLERFNSTDAVQISLYWEDAMLSSITDCAELSMAHWNGSSWDNIPSVTTGSCAGNDAGMLQTTSAISNFGDITFGFTDASVTVETLHKETNLKLYPNPSQGIFYLESTFSEGTISISDIRGNEMRTEKFVEKQKLDLSNFPAGMYFVKVIGGDEMKTERIVIVK